MSLERPTVDDFFAHRWRAQPENTIGGWCVTLEDDERTPADGAFTIACFVSEELAAHIAILHNGFLRAAERDL